MIATQSRVDALGFSAEEAEEVAKGFAIALKGEGKEYVEKIMPLQAEYAAFIGEREEAAQKKAAEELANEAKENKALGAAYMEKCKQDKAFRALESGVLVKIENAGDEKCKPTTKSFISVRYTGKLIDGTIFDSSDRNAETGAPAQFSAESEPAAFPFPLEGLIPGWIEALQQVGKGAKLTIVIPSDQAYGDRGTGNGLIKPGATLVFDLELVDVADKPAGADDEIAPENAAGAESK